MLRLLGKAKAEKPEEIQERYGPLFGEREIVEIGFKVIRDTFIFTNKRLIIVDAQGITGRKTEYLTIPYSKITKYSIETSGHFDLDADLKIWVGSFHEPIEKKFRGDSIVYELQRVLASYVL